MDDVNLHQTQIEQWASGMRNESRTSSSSFWHVMLQYFPVLSKLLRVHWWHALIHDKLWVSWCSPSRYNVLYVCVTPCYRQVLIPQSSLSLSRSRSQPHRSRVTSLRPDLTRTSDTCPTVRWLNLAANIFSMSLYLNLNLDLKLKKLT